MPLVFRTVNYKLPFVYVYINICPDFPNERKCMLIMPNQRYFIHLSNISSGGYYSVHLMTNKSDFINLNMLWKILFHTYYDK